MEHGKAAAAQWLLGKQLDRADTAAAIRWLLDVHLVVNKGDDLQWLFDMQLVADKHDHDDSEMQTPEHDVQTDMLGAYGEFGYDDWLMGDELPKDASAHVMNRHFSNCWTRIHTSANPSSSCHLRQCRPNASGDGLMVLCGSGWRGFTCSF